VSDRGVGTRGAVYVEFLVAFLPVLVFFMSLVQLADLQAASVVVQHAAFMATRAAIVVLPDDPAHYGGAPVNQAVGRRRRDIERAARAPLRAVTSTPKLAVTFPDASSGGDRTSFERDSLVRVRVEFEYECKVPIGRMVVCGPRASRRKLAGQAAMPNQGAGYLYAEE
jgi:hypothetical protein